MRRMRFILAGLGGGAAVALLAGALWAQSLGPVPLGQNLDIRTSCSIATAGCCEPMRPMKAVGDYRPRRRTSTPGFSSCSLPTKINASPRISGSIRFRSAGLPSSSWLMATLSPARPRSACRLRACWSRVSIAASARSCGRLCERLSSNTALGKEGVLSLYLTLAPYGGNLEGIRAASLAYFGKEPLKLSLAEAALLVALPQSPELRRPDRFPVTARDARDRVLDRVKLAGAVPRDECERAKLDPIPRERKQLPMLAPHAADQVVALEPDRRVHRLTIDLHLQKVLQDLARERARALGPDMSIAILAVDNASGEVRARVASADYFDARRAGQVDMTQALRSPGSTLKPFIYGLGFEDGLIHPDTLIDDKPARYGSYTPEDFDALTFQGHGDRTARAAIVANVPAVAVLGKVGATA